MWRTKGKKKRLRGGSGEQRVQVCEIKWETLRGERGRETWSGSIMGELETEREQV